MDLKMHVNKLLPRRIYSEANSLDVATSLHCCNDHADGGLSTATVVMRSNETVVSNLLHEIVALKVLSGTENVARKILLLRGSYGSGKTCVLKSLADKLVDSREFLSDRIWYFGLNQHSILESFFNFVAQKAEKHGIRDQQQVIMKTSGKFEDRKEAAVRVLSHCHVLLIDDVDLSKDFGGNFLEYISNENTIIVCTYTSEIYVNELDLKLFEIPGAHFDKIPFLDDPMFSENDENIRKLFVNLGPFYISIFKQAISTKFLALQDVIKSMELLDFDHETRNNIVENFFLLMFNKLSIFDQCLLLSIKSSRLPVPVKKIEHYKILRQLGLVSIIDYGGGKSSVQLPNNVSTIVMKIGAELVDQKRPAKHPTAFSIWNDLVPGRLKVLLEYAENQEWPFVPEAWQYKDIVHETERYNLKDVIHKKNEYSNLEEIDILQECCYNALVDKNYKTAHAFLFIMDRFVYWQGSTKWVISALDYIQEKSPDTAIAPQLVIRKARFLKNAGDIQGAIKIIDNVSAQKDGFGNWVYKSENCVGSVCIQIKGDILRGLGLWVPAAKELIKSIIGFKSLNKEDTKGWAASLSLLADAFQYMPFNDFQTHIRSQYNMTSQDPILEAIRCVHEAAKLSIHSPLFFAKNKRRAGELMLKYSRLLPEDSWGRYEYVMNAVRELREGLSCHTSISSLESHEQFYEFVACAYMLSQVMSEMQKGYAILKLYQNKGIDWAAMARNHLSLAKQLYGHYCSLVVHTKFSMDLIQTALQMINLPQIPRRENTKLPPIQESHASTRRETLSERIEQLSTNDESSTLSTESDFESSKNISSLEMNHDSLLGNDKNTATQIRTEVNIKQEATVGTEEAEDDALENSADDKLKLPDFKREIREADTFVTEESKESGSVDSGVRSLMTDTEDSTKEWTVEDDEGFSNHGSEEAFYSNENRFSPTDSSSQDMTPVNIKETSNLKEHRHNLTAELEFEKDEGRNGVATCDKPYLGNEATQTTEEAHVQKEEFMKRLHDTCETFEGSNKNLEDGRPKIEETLSIIRNIKNKVHSAKVWRFNPTTEDWSSSDTLAFIGSQLELGNKSGACRDAYMVEYINQEEPMGKYVGKQYRLEKYKDNPRTMQQYKQDIICQVTSRYYVTLFNQEMYKKGLSFGQVQFLPAVLVELTDVKNDPEKYYNVEPYMAGNFTKITNNLKWVIKGDVQGKDLLLAFSHFSYHISKSKVIIVDIQGWTSDDKTGRTFLTDPQIHTKNRRGFGTANKGVDGFNEFWKSQHPKCNDICKQLELRRPPPLI